MFTNILKHECTFGHQSLGVCEVSYTYLQGSLRYQEKHEKDACYCLQTCKSVVWVVVMELVLGQSLMVISTTGILLYAKATQHTSVLQPNKYVYCIMGVHCCCLHVKYTVYKHFGKSLHIGSLDPT